MLETEETTKSQNDGVNAAWENSMIYPSLFLKWLTSGPGQLLPYPESDSESGAWQLKLGWHRHRHRTLHGPYGVGSNNLYLPFGLLEKGIDLGKNLGQDHFFVSNKYDALKARGWGEQNVLKNGWQDDVLECKEYSMKWLETMIGHGIAGGGHGITSLN